MAGKVQARLGGILGRVADDILVDYTVFPCGNGGRVRRARLCARDVSQFAGVGGVLRPVFDFE